MKQVATLAYPLCVDFQSIFWIGLQASGLPSFPPFFAAIQKNNQTIKQNNVKSIIN